MSPTVYTTVAALAAILLLMLFLKPTDPTTIGLAITAMAGLGGFHLVTQQQQNNKTSP